MSENDKELIARARLIAPGDRVSDEHHKWTGTVTNVLPNRPTICVTWDHGGTTGYGSVAAGYLTRTGERVPLDALPQIETARKEWRRRHHASEPCTDDDVGHVARALAVAVSPVRLIVKRGKRRTDNEGGGGCNRL